jgi:hypothetical protein
MAYGVVIEAEYKDGYIHNEAELNDVSPYEPTRNILNDIINQRPVAEHGKMVRFTCIASGKRLDIDWADFPANAKPIYYRKMERKLNVAGEFLGDAYATGHYFGYEFHDQNAVKHKEIREV